MKIFFRIRSIKLFSTLCHVPRCSGLSIFMNSTWAIWKNLFPVTFALACRVNKEEEKKLADNINKQFKALELREALKQFYIETYCSYLKLRLIFKGMSKLRFFLAWMNFHFCPPFSYRLSIAEHDSSVQTVEFYS